MVADVSMNPIFLALSVSMLTFLSPETPAQSTEQQGESAIFIAPEPSEFDVLLQRARVASAEDKFDEALFFFEELEQSESRRHHWAAISGQVNIYRRQGNFDAARSVTARVIETEPQAVGLMHIWNGDIAIQDKNYDMALSEYLTAEFEYGEMIVNNYMIGELALKQATRAAIQTQHPDHAANFARKVAQDYSTVGNPEAALARALVYEVMAHGDLPVKTLETLVHDGDCTQETPCVIANQRLQTDEGFDRTTLQQLADMNEFYYQLNNTDNDILQRIRYPQQFSFQQKLSYLLVPKAKAQSVSYTTCDVESEFASEGFSDPISDISRGDLFMGYPASADGVSYHSGVDLNNPSDHVGGDLGDCSNAVDDFTTTAAGCVQDASTADWGSLAITHNYAPYDGDFSSDYMTSQYGHADEVYVSVGASVGSGEEVGSIGDVGSEGACHLHFEMREPDHPDPYNAGYWSTSVLSSQDNVGLYYQDPESFIDAHPAADWLSWIDEGASYWSYSGSWTYVDTKGNGNDEDENDLNYTSTTSSSSASATATLSFTPDYTGSHSLWMFVPWSTQSKSESVPVEMISVNDGSTLLSSTLNFYGNEDVGEGTCDEDTNGDGVWGFSSTKRCDEWIEVGSVSLAQGEEYELVISNNTGSSGDIIIIDDVIIAYEDSTGLSRVVIASDDEDPCVPPASGDWNVTTDCTLARNAIAPGNVIVEDSMTLTIGGGVTLDMDLSSYHLLIGDNSRVIIEIGGKID